MKNKLLTATFTAWVFIFIVLPIALIVFYSITVNDGDMVRFTWSNFSKFFTEDVYLKSLGRSLYLAFISTIICLLIGYPMAMILVSLKPKIQSFCVTLFVLPMWMNFLMRTYAWLTILENNGLINTLLVKLGFDKLELLYNQGAVVLGMVYNFLPFMVFPIYSSLTKTDRSVIEAAQDLGANKVKVFFSVTLPLSLSGVASGISMVFMPAVTTFVISRLMGGGHTSLIGDIIEQQFLYANNWNFASAISVVVMIILLVSMAVVPKGKAEETGGGGLW